MRNMSFSLTTRQFIDRQKTVTRRLGWGFLKPGGIVCGCEKCQGLKKGEKIKKLGVIKIISNKPEALKNITKEELILEGFPEMSTGEFIDMFCKANHCLPVRIVNRIEFIYV